MGKDLFLRDVIVEFLMFAIMELPKIADADKAGKRPNFQFFEHIDQKISIKQDDILIGVRSEKRRCKSFIRLTMRAENEIDLFPIKMMEERLEMWGPIFAFNQSIEMGESFEMKF